MEKAVTNLEALFQKAEVDLNLLSRKLQAEHGPAGSDNDNPVRLMTQLEEIKAEYSALARDITVIQTTQREAVSFFQSSLATVAELLGKLEFQSQEPVNTDMVHALYGELSQLMGVSSSNLLPAPASAVANQHTVTQNGSSVSRDEASSEPCLNTGKVQQKEAACPAMSAREKCHSIQFVEVTQEEFMSVSELVRGKVKLDDLNRTYRMLWQHYKEEGNTEVLTPPQMNAMGLRVSGATGEAKLKVLRALKLCQINKNGDVKLC